MLVQLDIQNFAIVSQLSVDFNKGMTAITGETGAGKSIALDALGLCLGARAEASMVRPGTRKAEIVASFLTQPSSEAKAWLTEHDLEQAEPDAAEECIIRRVISAEGRSKAFINGVPVPVSQLKDLGQHILCLHGQHDHHLLMKQEYQLKVLDQYAEHSKLLESVKQAWKNWNELKKESEHLHKQVKSVQARKQLLEYQVGELEAFPLTSEEFNELDKQHKKLANARTLLDETQFSLNSLYDGEHNNAYSLVQSVRDRLNECVDIDDGVKPALDLLNDACVQVEEAVHELRHYQDSIALDPEQLNECESQLQVAMQLAKKHQVAPQALAELRDELQDELEGLVANDERLSELDTEIDSALQSYQQAAKQLTSSRQKAARQLAREVTQSMNELNMPAGKFAVSFNSEGTRISPEGTDQITFDVSANAGQPLQSIQKVASGGELSRISLAIQVITASKDNLPTLVFDEVDVGVSGPTAATVGRLMRTLGEKNQVLCVTHLPQVAARAHHQMIVTKHSQGKQTITKMEPLSNESRVTELARLLGGDTVTDSSIANARELLAS